mgnify:CR=1 FL=1
MLRPRKKYTVFDLQQLKGKRCLTHIHVKSPEEAAAAEAAGVDLMSCPFDSPEAQARLPRLVAADAAFFSVTNEVSAHARGVTRVCIPNQATKSAERKREQKKRWFKNGQKWRTGCEGRISVVKRRHGMNRSRYKGDDGMKRWVGLGVIADNLINIGRVLATRAAT